MASKLAFAAAALGWPRSWMRPDVPLLVPQLTFQSLGPLVSSASSPPAAPGSVEPETAAAPAAAAAAAVPALGDYSACKSVSAGATDQWCVRTCSTGNCPESMCQCGQRAAFACTAKKAGATDLWCAATCKSGSCPAGATDLCTCAARGR